MTLHARRAQGNILTAFIGLLLLIVIGGLCALGGYFLGAKNRPLQLTTSPVNNQKPTNTVVSPVADEVDLLSRAIPFSADALASQCHRLKFAPLQRGDLAFDVVVPNNWTWQTVKVNQSELATSNTSEVQIAEIESPGSSLAIMQVWFMQVPADVSLSQFADSYIKARGFKMVEKAAEVGNRMDMLIGYDTGGQKDIQSRITALKVGDKIMWLASCAPRNEYALWNKAFTLAANSFSPAAEPVEYQPDVPTKLAQGAVLAKEIAAVEESKTKSRIPGEPAVPKNTADKPLADDKTRSQQSSSDASKGEEKKTGTTAEKQLKPPASAGSRSSSPNMLH